jgi:predicted MFS family arabinose efflux permease
MIKKVLPLSIIVALRFFGLFIVLSVLSGYAKDIDGGSAFLAGIALGGYALTQALFQLPFGLMSDKFGRKKSLFVGLIIFAIGSFIAAYADNIYTLLLGRFLQGAGAIGSVVTAMIADQVREDERAKAMAIMGMTIAMSFAIAMLMGPFIAGAYSVGTLFNITGILAISALIILFTSVPEPPKIIHHYEQSQAKVKDLFKDSELARMYVTFLFHSSTMAIAFFLIPIVLKSKFGLDPSSYWKVYLLAVVFGILTMAPAAILGEKYGKGKEVFMASIGFIIVSFLLMGFGDAFWMFATGVTMFFIGFNMFEPLLQSFVSKFAKVHQKGAALGVANTFSYLGIFIGGAVGGWLYQNFNESGVGIAVLILCLVWMVWIIGMKNPALRENLFLSTDEYSEDLLVELKSMDGISDFYINKSESLIVIKYESQIIDEGEIKKVWQKNTV